MDDPSAHPLAVDIGKATLAGMSPSFPPLSSSSACFPVDVCLEPGPSRQLVSELSALNLSSPPIDSLVVSVPVAPGPPLSSRSDPCDPCPRSSDSGPFPYNLRPRWDRRASGFAVGGLASNSVDFGIRKARGRKSNLSLTQSKAVVDIADGKQLTLPRVLRAERPPSGVAP